MENIAQIISTLGFPIAAFLLMWWQLREENASHREEQKELAAAVNNNTQALIHLADKLDGGTKHDS